MSSTAMKEHDSDADTLHSPIHGPGIGSPRQSLSDTETEKEEQKSSTDPEKQEPEGQGEADVGCGSTQNLRTGTSSNLHLQKIKATTPWKGFNPTSARFHVSWKDDENGKEGAGDSPPDRQGSKVVLHWSARYNRKGRNSFVVTPGDLEEKQGWSHYMQRGSSNFVRILKNIARMLFSFPYWDMAFWSGWSYSWGSVIFVIDGAFAWVPIAFPYTEFPGEGYSDGLLFFFGALLYEVGATVAYLEAINDGSFHGSAMKRILEGREEVQKKLLDEKLGAFFGNLMPYQSRTERKRKRQKLARLAHPVAVDASWPPGVTFEDPGPENYRPRRGGVDFGASKEEEAAEYLPWRWYPTWDNLKNHHIREIGWWACSIQLFGATLYGITGVVALPGILDSLQQWQENAAYWIPQIVASTCFLVASLLFTLETQEKWYKPELKVLGWWVGFWATVGSCGFLLCGALGPAYGNSGAVYQSSLSSTWGSAAYLFSALLQWYEAVNKHPIEELLNEPGTLKSFQVHPV